MTAEEPSLIGRSAQNLPDVFPPSNLEFTGIDTPTHASNVIPGTATAQLNIRFNNLHKGADLVRMVEEIAEREAPGAKVRAQGPPGLPQVHASHSPRGPQHAAGRGMIEKLGIDNHRADRIGLVQAEHVLDLLPERVNVNNVALTHRVIDNSFQPGKG